LRRRPSRQARAGDDEDETAQEERDAEREEPVHRAHHGSVTGAAFAFLHAVASAHVFAPQSA
jgi:hypothetical protein